MLLRCPLLPSTGKPEMTMFRAIKGKDALYLVQRATRAADSPEQVERLSDVFRPGQRLRYAFRPIILAPTSCPIDDDRPACRSAPAVDDAERPRPPAAARRRRPGRLQSRRRVEREQQADREHEKLRQQIGLSLGVAGRSRRKPTLANAWRTAMKPLRYSSSAVPPT